MTTAELIARLQAQANPVNVAGMARFGISSKNTLGVSVTNIRALAKLTPRDHATALQLWDSEIHEARMLATIIDRPTGVPRKQMQLGANDFESWHICDGACHNLFR